MTFYAPHPRLKQRAFTLIEILVSCGITMILVVLVISIVNSVLDQSRHIRQGGEIEREASLALDTISEDIEAMLVPQLGEGAALRLEMETVNGTPFPWVSLLSHAPDAEDGTYPGTPRAISLRAAYQDPVVGSVANPRHGLYRAIASSGVTFNSLVNLPDPQADFWGSTGGAPTHSWNDLLADHLYSIHFRFQRADTLEWIDPQTTGATVRIDRSGAYYRTTAGQETRVPGGILAIEVSLVLLTEQGSQLVRNGAVSRTDASPRFIHHTARRTVILPRGSSHSPAVAAASSPTP